MKRSTPKERLYNKPSTDWKRIKVENPTRPIQQNINSNKDFFNEGKKNIDE